MTTIAWIWRALVGNVRMSSPDPMLRVPCSLEVFGLPGPSAGSLLRTLTRARRGL